MYYTALHYQFEELLPLGMVLEGKQRHSAPQSLVLGVDLLALPLGLLVLGELILVEGPQVGDHAPVVELDGPLLLQGNVLSASVAASDVRLQRLQKKEIPQLSGFGAMVL